MVGQQGFRRLREIERVRPEESAFTERRGLYHIGAPHGHKRPAHEDDPRKPEDVEREFCHYQVSHVDGVESPAHEAGGQVVSSSPEEAGWPYRAVFSAAAVRASSVPGYSSMSRWYSFSASAVDPSAAKLRAFSSSAARAHTVSGYSVTTASR